MDSLENTFTAPPPSPTTHDQDQDPNVKLADLVIKDENTALNVMISFVGLAQKRGVYNLEESAKLWECVQMFMKKTPTTELDKADVAE